MNYKLWPCALLAASTLLACSESPTSLPQSQDTATAPISNSAEDAAVTSNFENVYASISAADLRQQTKTLSSDEFGGRLPTTPGEKKTLDYLVNAFSEAGLQPGNGDSFLQPVDLIQITANPDMTMTIGDNSFTYQTDMVASS